MDSIRRFFSTLGRLFALALGLLGVLAILWAIVYRFILPFTPPWLDALTYGAAGVAILAGLAVAKRSPGQK